MTKKLSASICLIFVLFLTALGQDQGNQASADRTLRGSGRVNASTLGIEFDLPLGSYPGRGINVPISLSYSSKVWRSDYIAHTPIPGSSSDCYPIYDLKYGEDTASGWTSSLAAPYIENIGYETIYYDNGGGITDEPTCSNTTVNSNYAYVRRLLIHLPGGETHELRPDDALKIYPPGSNCFDPNYYCSPSDPSIPTNWDAIYYAVDRSNIRYVQNSTNGTYRLLMPDGSFYDFVAGIANKFTDRNGNYTTYYGPGSVDDNNVTHPNGYWKDTLGRNISIPLGLEAPPDPTTAQNPQVYSLPGMTGTYKLHWKNLKGSTAVESGLTNFSDNLRYVGDWYHCVGSSSDFCERSPGTFLFSGNRESFVWGVDLFNPIVLTEIELPTGQKYKFTYDVYGRIERIYYPTGGEERFEYDLVPTLGETEPFEVSEQTNFGVKKRQVYQTAGQGTPYEWNYSAARIGSTAYKVGITAPDGVISQRFLHRGNENSSLFGNYGFDNALSGMPYEERVFSNTGQIVSRKLTHWTKSTFTNINSTVPDWHPRVDFEESYIYDSTGSGVKTTSISEFENGSSLTKESPILVKKASQYAFETVSGGGSITPTSTAPTPITSTSPTTLLRTSENTFLINDTSISQTDRNQYYDLANLKNMVGLVTASVVKDAAGTIVSRSEMRYDDASYSPNVGRGNPTASRVWDSTKGNYDNANAYIETKARFDTYGNQYEAIDANLNSTTTTFDATYHAFPIQVTTVAPGNGTNGSNTAFTTTATYDTTTGLPLTTTDADGLETRISYDPATLRPLNTKTYYQNAQVGSEAETIYHDEINNYWVKNRARIDGNNWAESITYFDGLGRAYKAEQVDANGNIFVEKEFDQDGRVLRVTNPFRTGEAKQWTTNVYDDASRVIEVILPDGAKVKTDYGVSTDAGFVGTTKQITDQAGKKRKGINDALGRMIRVIEDPTGSNLPTDYVFDTLGNLRKTIQGEQSRYFMHDSLGRLLYAKQPEQEANTAFVATDPVTNNSNWSVKYEYDDSGNITKTTDARGGYVQGTYDKFNRLILRDYSDNTPDVSFFYDGTGLGAIPAFSKGKTTKVSSSVSETRYKSFDNLGRLLTHEQITGGQTYATAYTYNLSGALLTETYPSGRVVTNNYNTDGELESVWGQKANQQTAKLYINQITLNSSGAVEKARLGNGTWETAAYNERLQITQIGLGHSATDKSLLKIDYDYGNNQQNNGSLRQQKVNFAGLANEITQNYTYDDLNRIKSATETVSSATSWKQTFNYDRFGNRTFDAANTTTMISSKATNPIIQSSDNRIKKDQDNDSINDYDYDANGNLKLDADNQRYVFDAENRIKEFFNSANTSNNNPNATYEYDGEGKRVKKFVDGVTTIFVYNAGGTLVAEYSTELSPEPQVSYLTSDHLGSPRIVTDGGGAVISRHDYMAFGDEVTTKLGNVGGRSSAQGYGTPENEFGSSDDVRKQYTGYERDKESGLDYAQARYYNSNHGRFTSVDPLTASASIRNPQTFNRYSYVLNSPYKFTDPLGLLPVTTGANGGRSWCSTCQTSDDDNGGYAEEITVAHEATHATQQVAPPPPDDRPYLGDMVEESTRIGNLSEERDKAGGAAFDGSHDGIHVMTSLDIANVNMVGEGHIIYWNVQRYDIKRDGENKPLRDRNGDTITDFKTPLEFTIHVRTADGKNVFILKDMKSVSNIVGKLKMKAVAMDGRNGNLLRGAVKVSSGDLLGTVGKNLGLHIGITPIGRWDTARGKIAASESYGNRNVLQNFIDPCGAASPVRCK